MCKVPQMRIHFFCDWWEQHLYLLSKVAWIELSYRFLDSSLYAWLWDNHGSLNFFMHGPMPSNSAFRFTPQKKMNSFKKTGVCLSPSIQPSSWLLHADLVDEGLFSTFMARSSTFLFRKRCVMSMVVWSELCWSRITCCKYSVVFSGV